jgi:hypothetical protein
MHCIITIIKNWVLRIVQQNVQQISGYDLRHTHD